MAVYVDDMQAAYGRMRMSHMLADSSEELLAMADRIGLARRWLQYAGDAKEHFDVCQQYRQRALAAGAQAISMREVARLVQRKRRQGDTMRLTGDDVKADAR